MRSPIRFGRVFALPALFYRALSRAFPAFLWPLLIRERFKILAMDRVGPRVVRVRLVPESGRLRPYRAGQFLYVHFDIPGPRCGTLRCTISNAPGDRALELLVKGTTDGTLALYDRSADFPGPSGAQPELLSRPSGPPFLGDEGLWTALVAYPYGSFTTRHSIPGSWVFLAEGIGIAPFLAMAGDKLPDHTRILILWAAGNRDELAGFEQLSAINSRRPSIRLVPILDHDPLWPGQKGLLDKKALEDLAGSELADSRSRYWICCTSSRRKTLVKALKELGVPGRCIRYEDCIL